MAKSAKKNGKIERKFIDSKDACVRNLIHMQIHCNIENYKINLKHCALY